MGVITQKMEIIYVKFIMNIGVLNLDVIIFLEKTSVNAPFTVVVKYVWNLDVIIMPVRKHISVRFTVE
jgi:hypothetical protein